MSARRDVVIDFIVWVAGDDVVCLGTDETGGYHLLMSWNVVVVVVALTRSHAVIS